MGETTTRLGGPGRAAAAGIACACLLSPGTVAAQARGLAGSIVQFEESAGRTILYHETSGTLHTNAPPAPPATPAPRATPTGAAPASNGSTRSNGAGSIATATVTPRKTAPAKAPAKASPPQGVAMRP